MKELERILSELIGCVQEYEGGSGVTKQQLVELQRSLSTNTYYLTQHNIKAFERWNNLKYNFTGSNAAAETFANEQVPELRKTRKILEAVKNVQIAISNEIGIIKNE